MKTVYLGGAINGCTDNECNDWREFAREKLAGFKIKNPMDRDYRGREAECVDEIVELDKIDIMESDILLMYYKIPSVGTSMEILYGWGIHKEIVLVHDSDKPISPWLKYHSTTVCKTLKDALYSINEAI